MAQLRDILVTLPLEQVHRDQLQQALPGGTFHYQTEQELDGSAIGGFDAIIGTVPLPLLKGAVRLKLLQLPSAGAEGYSEPGALPQGAALTCATGAYGRPVAEHAFAMLVCLQKKLHLYRDNQLQGLWRDRGPVGSVADCTVLVVGMGDIGSRFAGMAKAFGAHLIGVRRTFGDKPDCYDEQYPIGELDSLLPRADVILLCLPGTKETKGLFGTAQLARMKRSAILLNVGRGSAVDTEALCDAVGSGQIAAAGLDVVDPEPLSADHRLWKIENILLTPHSSGGFRMRSTLDKVVEIAAENLRLTAAGQPLRNLVRPGRGYADSSSKAK